MKYHITEEDGCCIIKMSGKTKKNEALMAKEVLSPHLKKKGIKLIMELKGLEKYEPITLIGVLNSIRKEVNLVCGELKVCSLTPEIHEYIRKNRLNRIFGIFEDKEAARKSKWRENDGRE